MTYWQNFERLAQIIQLQLSPDAVVTHNERLRGKSGVDHQCDVVVRSKVGQFDFTCVIECKDLAEKVGLEIVRGVVSRIEDLGVSQGVIVSARGFTEDALKFATAKGLLGYTLVDAETAKWAQFAMLPTLAVFIYLKNATAGFSRIIDGEKILFRAVLKTMRRRASFIVPVVGICRSKHIWRKHGTLSAAVRFLIRPASA